MELPHMSLSVGTPYYCLYSVFPEGLRVEKMLYKDII